MNLTTLKSPWNTSLTFNFFDEATTFRFLAGIYLRKEFSPRTYSALAAGKCFYCKRLQCN